MAKTQVPLERLPASTAYPTATANPHHAVRYTNTDTMHNIMFQPVYTVSQSCIALNVLCMCVFAPTGAAVPSVMGQPFSNVGLETHNKS